LGIPDGKGDILSLEDTLAAPAMGVVRGPIGGIPQLDIEMRETPFVDFAKAAQTVSPIHSGFVSAAPLVSVAIPPLPVPVIPKVYSVPGVTCPAFQGIAAPVLTTSEPVFTVTPGPCPHAARTAYPAPHTTFTTSAPFTLPSTTGTGQSVSGFVSTHYQTHPSTLPTMTQPTPANRGPAHVLLQSDPVETKNTDPGLPLRVRLGPRARPAPHSRRSLRRPRRSPVVAWYEPGLPGDGAQAGYVASHAVTPLLKSRKGPVAPKVLVWHCKHPHGLFSMFSLALGHMETCEKQGTALIVDWSSDELLYKGPPGEPNVWNAFFYQPAELKMAPEVLRHAIATGQYTETNRHSTVFGNFRGVIQDYGRIPVEQAARGRAFCKRNIVLRPRFQDKLQGAMKTLSPGRRLAVHIRRSDKACEAAANFELSDERLQERITSQCAAWHMDGVLLCTDDASLKQRLTNALEQIGLSVSTYNSTLPTDASKAVHFDKSLDSYQKAEDVVMETFLMAKGCHGLLSTYSNVSATVVYLSDENYPYTTFWDPVQANMQDALEGPVSGLDV